MKKSISLLLLTALMITLSACCKGNVSNVSINNPPSEIYTEKDIDEAIECAINYFEKEFKDCSLIEIAYAGDEKKQAFCEWAAQYDVDEVIILVSSFEVGASGGDGSLNPNDTYIGWQWILGKNSGGNWEHLTHGYG